MRAIFPSRLPVIPILACFLCGCSGLSIIPSPTSAQIKLVVSPGASVNVVASQSVQFTATNGASSEPMTWGFQSGVPQIGTLTPAGQYTAPVLIGTNALALIQGISTVHNGATVTARIVLTNPAPSVAALSPVSAAAATPYSGTITGAQFTPGSIVLVNSQPVTTTRTTNSSLSFSFMPLNGSSGVSIQVMTPLPGGGTSAPINLPITPGGLSFDAAVRFLEQASWGPTSATVTQVQQLGLSAYLDQQLALPVDSLVTDDNNLHVYENLWNNAVSKPSQLRQKTMWAWYKMFNTPGSTKLEWTSQVPELLQRDAFANYTKLLQDMSLNSWFGIFLNFAGANSAGPDPNQNFARELQQIFTTGPYVLQRDGTVLTLGDGSAQPQYTQTDVSEVARAMTGWLASSNLNDDPEGLSQMVMPSWQGAHDTGPKTVQGVVTPGGGDALGDMIAITSQLAASPNTATFLSKRLIKHFVTSNPSPTYISRVSGVWLDDGTGVRGNVAAVIKAILLDPEARAGDDPEVQPDATEGRVMDSVEFQIRTMRVLGTSVEAVFLSRETAPDFNESALNSTSVFGYYPSSYTLPGTTIMAPELALFTTSTLTTKAGYLQQIIYALNGNNVSIDWSGWSALATGDGSPLIDQINHVCLNGTMSAGLRQILLQAFQEAPSSNDGQAKRLLYLTLMSPEFAVIR